MHDGAAASYVNCTVTGNTMFHGAGGSGVMHANVETFTEAHLRLQGVALSNNTLGDLPTVFVDNGGSNLTAAVYSDDSSLQVCAYEGVKRSEVFEPICDGPANDTFRRDGCYRPQPCVEEAPLPLAESAADDAFISAEDEWFVQVQQVFVKQL